MMANGVGIGDEDYCGNDDEYCVPLYNFSNKPASLKREERVVQMLILPVDRVEWGEVDELASPNRGGFGSTGT
jgi:dUTP pyrophosphatase